MTFDQAKTYQTHLDHLIRMARIEGWKQYAWERAKELDKTELFSGIAQDLVKHMKESK